MAGHTQVSQVTLAAGDRRLSLDDEGRLTPLYQEVPNIWTQLAREQPSPLPVSPVQPAASSLPQAQPRVCS